MTGVDIGAILTGSALLLTAAGTLWNGIQIHKTERHVEQIHHATNSMKDELVREVRTSSLAAGMLAGKAEQKKLDDN